MRDTYVVSIPRKVVRVAWRAIVVAAPWSLPACGSETTGAADFDVGVDVGVDASTTDSIATETEDTLLADAMVDADAAVTFPIVRCLADGSNCPAVAIAGDPASTAPGVVLSGYADPTIRRDLAGGKLFMGYTWPTEVEGILTLTHHLAESDDEGATWTLVKTLFSSTASLDIPGSSVRGTRNSEEISLASGALDPSKPTMPYWLSVREEYYRPLTSGAMDSTTYHLRIGVVQSASPEALADNDANEQVMLNVTDSDSFRSAMPADHIELTDLLKGSGQSDCTYPVSPTIYYDATSQSAYLAFQCSGSLVMFSTKPFSAGTVLPVTRWTWSYRGTFGGPATAALMPIEGIPAFTPNQIFMPELTRGRDGTMLLVATPVIYDASGAGRTGCQILEMASLDPPMLKMVDGQLVRRGVANAAFLDPTRYQFGKNSGSCGYEPTATGVGLVFAWKQKPSTIIESSLHATGIHQ